LPRWGNTDPRRPRLKLYSFPEVLVVVILIILSLYSRRPSRRNQSNVTRFVVCVYHNQKPNRDIAPESYESLFFVAIIRNAKCQRVIQHRRGIGKAHSVFLEV
jgi:hypothetical protein